MSDAAPTPEGVVLRAEEREALARRIITRYYERGIQTNETALTATAHAAVDVFAAERAAHDELRAAVEALADEWDALAEGHVTAATEAISANTWLAGLQTGCAGGRANAARDLRAALAAGVRGES